jgi:hypothetical protein
MHSLLKSTNKLLQLEQCIIYLQEYLKMQVCVYFFQQPQLNMTNVCTCLSLALALAHTRARASNLRIEYILKLAR